MHAQIAAQRPGDINPAPEAAIKAAVVANLPKFVEWPSGAFQSPSQPFVVGLLGEGAVADSVVAALTGKRLGDRTISVTRLSKIEEASACHLLYLSPGEERRLDAILKALDGRPVLTIADFNRFAQRGGMVGLIVQDGRVRFEINERATRASRLHLSADLLKLAAAVIS